jgi:membrane protease YdiL (CAAX protease family)
VPFRRNSGHNYLVSLVILLIIVVVLAAIAFLLAFYLPGTLARAPFSYEIKELYNFEPWTFKWLDLELSCPEGGVILPLYRQEKQEAAIIFADGEYKISGEPFLEPKPAGIFIVTSEKSFEKIRDHVILVPSEDPETRLKMKQIYEQQMGLPVIWQNVIPLTFVPAIDATYYYFLSDEGKAISPPVLNEPPGKLYGSLALYSIFILIVLLMMTVFSLDHHPSRYWKTLYQTRPGNTALGLTAVITLLTLGGELLPFFSGWPEYSLVCGYLAAIVLLIILAYYKIIHLWDFGISGESLRQGYFLAIATALMFMFITRGIPQQLSFKGIPSVAGLIVSILIIGLARELVWRGYIQTVLGRQWGTTTGLLLTAVLAGLVHFATVALSSPELLSYPYILVELLILTPGSAIVLGYLYLRTENILSCALLHGLLLSLSSLTI